MMQPKDLSRVAQQICRRLKGFERFLMTWRPRICPFHILMEYIPAGSRVLDIGCGNGLWLLLLSRLGRISGGIGLELNPTKISTANSLKQPTDHLRFIRYNEREDWPVGCDCLSIIDVLHHVPVEQQRLFLQRIVSTHAERIVFKDIDPKPKLKRFLNTCHDLVLARQLPNYCKPANVRAWLNEIGYSVRCYDRADMAWYSHYLIVANKA
jgi:2-polyprenyl-3-methyl-5-hydroxy-6-metoxy-1,4-benzoquinol methylase